MCPKKSQDQSLPRQFEFQARKLNSRGQALGLAPNGKEVFVDGLVPGERALVQLVEEKRTYARARVLERTATAAERREPACPYFPQCGGCSLQHLDYQAQLQHKQQQLRYCLHSIGRFSYEELDSSQVFDRALASPQELRYRSKSQMPLACQDGQPPRIGFYRTGSQEIVDGSSCLIQDLAADQARLAFRQTWAEAQSKLPREARKAGFWRHLLVRVSQAERRALVSLVIRKKISYEPTALLPFLSQYRRRLKSCLAERQCQLGGLYLNFQPEANNRIHSWDFLDLGPSLDRLEAVDQRAKDPQDADALEPALPKPRLTLQKTGQRRPEASITEVVNGIRYPLGPASFFQINVPQTAEIYRQIRNWVQELGAKVIYDLYCGAGSISLQLAQDGLEVYGIEIVQEAVHKAQEAARLNGLEAQCQFAAGAAENLVPQLVQAGVWPLPDCLVVDPPRKGLDAQLSQFIATELQPAKVIYLSCDPASLARDLALLRDRGGYQLRRFIAYDLFPQTMHVETVCLMTRGKD